MGHKEFEVDNFYTSFRTTLENFDRRLARTKPR